MQVDELKGTKHKVEQENLLPEVAALLDTNRNLVATTTENLVSTKPTRPDEINVQLSFRFACSNSFKILIGLSISLAVAWNIYISINNSCNSTSLPQSSPTPQPNRTTVPVPRGVVQLK